MIELYEQDVDNAVITVPQTAQSKIECIFFSKNTIDALHFCNPNVNPNIGTLLMILSTLQVITVKMSVVLAQYSV